MKNNTTPLIPDFKEKKAEEKSKSSSEIAKKYLIAISVLGLNCLIIANESRTLESEQNTAISETTVITLEEESTSTTVTTYAVEEEVTTETSILVADEEETLSVITENLIPIVEYSLLTTEVSSNDILPKDEVEKTEETSGTRKARCIVNDSRTKSNSRQNEINKIVSSISPEMDISGVSGISKEDFVFALKNCKYDKCGVLGETAEYIWDTCQEFNVNEFAVVGIIVWESGWCSSKLAKNKHNIMSVKSGSEYKAYESYEESIYDGIKLLSQEYIEADGRYHTGGVLLDIERTYTGYEDTVWAEHVAECAEMCTYALTE